MDPVGVIDVFIPNYVLEESLSEASTSDRLIVDIESYIDDQYNLSDVYYFTPKSSRTISKLFNKFNNLEE